jgi:hypothetical protein
MNELRKILEDPKTREDWEWAKNETLKILNVLESDGSLIKDMGNYSRVVMLAANIGYSFLAPLILYDIENNNSENVETVLDAFFAYLRSITAVGLIDLFERGKKEEKGGRIFANKYSIKEAFFSVLEATASQNAVSKRGAEVGVAVDIKIADDLIAYEVRPNAKQINFLFRNGLCINFSQQQGVYLDDERKAFNAESVYVYFYKLPPPFSSRD